MNFRDPKDQLEDAQKVAGHCHQIKSARHDAPTRCSQVELARRVGTTHARICYLENNPTSNPTVKTLGRIAKELGMNLYLEFVSDADLIDKTRNFSLLRRKRIQDQKAALELARMIQEGQL